MKPNTRLLISLTYSNGDIQGWGYDYPHYPTAEILQESIDKDFTVMPEHTKISLLYFKHETTITSTTGTELAQKTISWLKDTGDYV